MDSMRRRYNMRNNLVILYICFGLISCNESTGNQSRVENLPYFKDATFTPQWISENATSLDSFHKIAPFSLLNQEGEIITQKDFMGKIYVADFFFTSCPGICPKMTSNMKILQDQFLLDTEVLLLSHSVTPQLDSVAVLKEYAMEKGVLAHKWYLATGDRKEIYDLGRNSYFVEEDLGLKKTEDDFLHSENFVLVDQNGHIRGVYNGLNKSAIKQLIADINLLKGQTND